jgi:hypothetical protein
VSLEGDGDNTPEALGGEVMAALLLRVYRAPVVCLLLAFLLTALCSRRMRSNGRKRSLV